MGAGLQASAALIVARDECTGLPILAKLNFVAKQIWSPSKVLKIVSVYALRLVVVVVEGAPLGFEIKDVEVEISNDLARLSEVNEPDFDVFHRVSKGTIVSIFTCVNLRRVLDAEFSLVLIFVIQAFYSVVCSSAFRMLGTSLGLSKLTQFRSVKIITATSILERMKKVAAFVVVGG